MKKQVKFGVRRFRQFSEPAYRGFYAVLHDGKEIYRQEIDVTRLTKVDALMDAKREWVYDGGKI